MRKSNVKQFILLLKRLEIGLIGVFDDQAEVMVETFGFDLKRSVSNSQKNKAKLLKEFTLRKDTSNQGGTNGKVLTHYKEKAIVLLSYLNEFGPKSPKEIIKHTSITDGYNILRKNHYGWFKNPERGLYTVSEIGSLYLSDFQTN